MSRYEGQVRQFVDAGGTAFYRVTPIYDGSVYPIAEGIPDSVRIQALGVSAEGKIGLNLDVKIVNIASSKTKGPGGTGP